MSISRHMDVAVPGCSCTRVRWQRVPGLAPPFRASRRRFFPWRGASGWSIVAWHPGGHDTGRAEVLKWDLRIPPMSRVGAEQGSHRR